MGEEDGGYDDDGDNDIEGGKEAEEYKKNKTGKKNQATANTLAIITYIFNNVLAFLQAVAVKSTRATAATLSFRANKFVRA